LGEPPDRPQAEYVHKFIRTFGSTRTRRVATTIVGSLVFLMAFGAGAYGWLHGDAGRAWLGRTIEQAFNGGVRGSLRIGRIHELRGFSVVASDVVFVDPRGHDVIAIQSARLGIRPLDLLRGKVRLRAASARGVVVRVIPGVRNSTSLEDAFEGHGGGATTDLDTGSIAVSDGRVRVAMGGPAVMFNALHGAVRIVLPKGGQVRVKLERFAGRFNVPTFAAFQGRNFRTVGWVHAGDSPVLEFHVRACLRDQPMPIRIRYSPHRLSILFDADDNELAGTMVSTIAAFSPKIHAARGRVRLASVDSC